MQAKRTCRQFEAKGKCSYGAKCHFEHAGKPAPKPAPKNQSGWQVVSGKRGRRQPDRDPEYCPVLKVHSKANMHPGRWRDKLKVVDEETYESTNWVCREGDWFILHAVPDCVDDLLDRLKPLRQLDFTVDVICEVSVGGDKESESVCADFLRGVKCNHRSPCKQGGGAPGENDNSTENRLPGTQANREAGGRKRRKKKKKRKGQEQNQENQCGAIFGIGHWSSRGLLNKAPILKKKMADLGVKYCGVAESHTYRSAGLSDDKWVCDAGVDNRPSSAHPHPPGGIGSLVSRDVSHSTVASGKYSVWTRLEFEGGVPDFICECYFPHSGKVRQHRAAWREVSARASEYGEVGHVVVMGDFNAHIGVNGGSTDTAGRMMLRWTRQLDLHILNGTDLCDGGHTRVMEKTDGSATSTTIDFIMVSKSLIPHVAGMSVVGDRMGSDHCMLVLNLAGLRPTAGAKVKLREVWKVEGIPHHKDPHYQDMVLAYQKAFRVWYDSTKTAIAAADDDAERGDELERSFQSCLDDVSLEQLGRKLIGPSSTGLMTQQVKDLNFTRLEREKELRRVLSDPRSSHEDRSLAVLSYRQAKAASLQAVQSRREDLELQIFKQIESTQSDSKLFWSHVSKISGGLLSSVSPPPMAVNGTGEVETDPVAVLKVWKEFSSGIANPGPMEEGIYDDDHKVVVESRMRDLRAGLCSSTNQSLMAPSLGRRCLLPSGSSSAVKHLEWMA